MRTLPNGIVIAEGEVQVKGEGVVVTGDSLKYDPGSDTLILTGNVVMKEDGGGAFTGDTLALDLADLTGGISRGEIIIVPNGFRVFGEDINRIGPEEYSVRKGVITSCPGDCPDWSFTASKIEVRKEGYLKARHAAFRILGVPVFYTPYLLYPVKTNRQTGLLFPEIGFSDKTGFESTWPLFITLGPHADATVSPRTFSRDSFGLDFDSRYRLDWGGGGQISGFAMTGENNQRWYLEARNATALTPDLWLRWRWYDAGDPTAPPLFGDTYEERHPGAVYRHATLEGDHGILGYNFQSSSLLTDGTQARSDIPGTILDRQQGTLRIGSVGGDRLWAGVEVEETLFEGGQKRTLATPTVTFRIPGPEILSGYISGQGIFGAQGDGSTQDETYLFSLKEKLAVEASGDWGRHRMGLDLTASSAQSAAFGGSAIRDREDVVEEREIVDLRVNSLLTSSRWKWDLTVGAWKDWALELERVYGATRLSYRSLFLKASRNRDAEFELVLPSLATGAAALKGWQVGAGYETGAVGLAVTRDSTEGSPEILRGEGHFKVVGVRVSAQTYYDMDADVITDETIRIYIPGRCWSVSVGRFRSPEKTDWSLQMELGI